MSIVLSPTAAPRDLMRQRKSSVSRKLSISDLEPLAASPISPTSPRSVVAEVPTMKESDLDELGVEDLKSVSTAIIHSRNKVIQKSPPKSPNFLSSLLDRKKAEEVSRANQILQKRKKLSEHEEKSKEYSQLLQRLGIQTENLHKLESVMTDLVTEHDLKIQSEQTLRKKCSDLKKTHLENMKSLEDEIAKLNSQNAGCLQDVAKSKEKIKQKEEQIQTLKRKITDHETEFNSLIKKNTELENEIQLYGVELENKESNLKMLELSIEKTGRDINNLQSEKDSLSSAQTTLVVEQENLAKKCSMLNIGIGLSAIFGVGAFTASFLSKK